MACGESGCQSQAELLPAKPINMSKKEKMREEKRKTYKHLMVPLAHLYARRCAIEGGWSNGPPFIDYDG
jgi:hypothetical protein